MCSIIITVIKYFWRLNHVIIEYDFNMAIALWPPCESIGLYWTNVPVSFIIDRYFHKEAKVI